MKVKKIFYILFFVISTSSVAQQKENSKPSVQVIARSFVDSIIIRWAANTPMGWKLSNQHGYVIERYTLLKDGKFDKKKAPEKTILSSQSIKPWPLEKWETLAKKNNYGAIAAQAIYGKSFQHTNKSTDVVQAISLAKELEARFSFALFAADQSLEVAQACGLKFTDNTIKKGEKYVYKIYSLVPKQTYAIDTGYVFIGSDENYSLPKPIELKAEFSDKVVMLSWNKIYYEHIYTTYFIERSSDGGNTFISTDNLPLVNTSPSSENNAQKIYKVDSLPENNKIYVFRVRGITPFEEIGPPSDTVQGMGKSVSLKLAPSITSIRNMKDGGIEIKWRFPEEYNSKIKEFEILKCNVANGHYRSVEKLLPIQRGYVDTKPERVNYYVIKVIESNGTYVSSFPGLGQLIDSIPPLPPIGIVGKIDSVGILKLIWEKGEEDDIIGYRVYMANSPEEEFTQITREPVRDTVFIDTVNINTITPKVYFKIMSMDLNYNLSSFSQIMVIKRPDIIPPVSPLFETYTASDTAIYLRWITSTSNDVEKHILYRREKYKSEWELVKEWRDSTREYFDNNVVVNKNYEYSIIAVDDANLVSDKKQVITVSLIDSGIREEIKNIETKVDRLNKQIEIKWEYGNQKPERFIVYRSVKGTPLRIYNSVLGTEISFIDKQLAMNTIYLYRVKAIYADGGESPLSKELEVKY